MSGLYFGPANYTNSRVTVTYGVNGVRYTAANCRILNDHRVITCFTVEGTGANHTVQVTIDGVVSLVPPNVRMSYGAPSIVSYRGNGSHLANTTGFEVLAVSLIWRGGMCVFC